MGVISGVNGAVDGSGSVRTWEVTATNDVVNVFNSATKGMAITQPGNDDWSGSYTAHGHTPVRMPGQGFTFTGSVDGTNGVTGTAIVDSVEIVINIETGEKIGHTVNFSGNGALSKGAAAATDTSTPDTPTSIGAKVEIATPAAVPSWGELEDVRTVTITITAENQSYVNSGTEGGTRRAVGNLSASLSIDVHTDDPNDLPDEGDVRGVRVFVNATEFWLFDWIVFNSIGPISVDIEGAGIVEATVAGEYTGYTAIGGDTTEGEITNPADTTFWPPA